MQHRGIANYSAGLRCFTRCPDHWERFSKPALEKNVQLRKFQQVCCRHFRDDVGKLKMRTHLLNLSSTCLRANDYIYNVERCFYACHLYQLIRLHGFIVPIWKA